jgi:aspartyl protease family protein
MSNLSKLIGTILLGSATLAYGVGQLRERPDVMTTMVERSSVSLRGAASPPPANASGNVATLYSDARGHFLADVQIGGVPIKVLVDTGATLVALSAEDANKIGVRSSPSDRKARFNTANGIVTASLVRLPEIRLQGITIFDVEAAVMPTGALKGTLLGMSFMKKLASFESRGVSMVMRK